MIILEKPHDLLDELITVIMLFNATADRSFKFYLHKEYVYLTWKLNKLN